MNNIYLASKSKARQELLKKLGLKFKIKAVRIKEREVARGISFASLVKLNALDKAKAAAKEIKSGVIIAADTICVQNGKIFGKPRDLKHAKLMLKALSSKPQWLYSGIAVINKTRKGLDTRIEYEKTKVYMDKLSEKEIDNYFKIVSPLDKAGSFDIQGKGAFFIPRIEGCFYNVVGLPLRKLYICFKKLHIPLYLFLISILLIGCSTEYNIVTKEQESYHYSTDKEVQMGQSISKAIQKEMKLAQDSLIQKRVEDIGKKIALVSDRKEIDYYFFVLDDDEINAVSLPGGFIYVNSGLVEKVANDDELACVLAHEIGHIVARHSIKKLQGMQAYSIVRLLVAVAPTSGEVGNAADIAFTELMLGYSREDELLADQLGARYAKLAGYDPHGMVTFLEKLQDNNRRKPLAPKSYFKTHPYVPDRVRVVKQELGEGLSFDDYINIEQDTHK